MRKAEVGSELGEVFRDNNGETGVGVFDFDQLHDFKVIVVNFCRERERAYVDDVHIGVLDVEKTRELSILSLF